MEDILGDLAQESDDFLVDTAVETDIDLED